jgi:hypothetical protein
MIPPTWFKDYAAAEYRRKQEIKAFLEENIINSPLF